MERRRFLKPLAAGAVAWVTVGKAADEFGLAPAYMGQIQLTPSAEAAGFGSSFVIDASLTAKFQATTFP